MSTLDGHSPEPIPPLEYEHLLTHMWEMALDNPIIVLPLTSIYTEKVQQPMTHFHPLIICLAHRPFIPSSSHEHPLPTRIQYLLIRVPLGYLVGEVADPEILKDELEELTIFIIKLGRVSKPVTYLHLEGKGK